MKAGTENAPLSKRVKSILGEKFGRLTVFAFAGMNENRVSLWECVCDCGGEVTVLKHALTTGHTQSCGCLYQDTRKTCARVHGGCLDGATEPEYACWQGMMKRCLNPKHKSYSRYGGAGVTICPEFQDYLKFKAAMGPRPSPNHSIDRFPNRTGNYEVGNVRWATHKEQQRNMKSNRLLTFNGETLPMSQWSEKLGFKPSKLKCRMAAHWTVERALTTP